MAARKTGMKRLVSDAMESNVLEGSARVDEALASDKDLLDYDMTPFYGKGQLKTRATGTRSRGAVSPIQDHVRNHSSQGNYHRPRKDHPLSYLSESGFLAGYEYVLRRVGTSEHTMGNHLFLCSIAGVSTYFSSMRPEIKEELVIPALRRATRPLARLVNHLKERLRGRVLHPLRASGHRGLVLRQPECRSGAVPPDPCSR